MRSHLRALTFAIAVVLAGSACTPLEVVQYLTSTGPTRDAVSSETLARLRFCESTDNYRAISRSGMYRGAYQFDQPTWNGVAERHFPWLVGMDPIDAAPWWQDAMARALWSERGSQPWPVCRFRI